MSDKFGSLSKASPERGMGQGGGAPLGLGKDLIPMPTLCVLESTHVSSCEHTCMRVACWELVTEDHKSEFYSTILASLVSGNNDISPSPCTGHFRIQLLWGLQHQAQDPANEKQNLEPVWFTEL